MKVQLYTPYDKQISVHGACTDKETYFTTVVAGRQAGKSLLSINQALSWALTDPGSLVFWVSPTHGQAAKIYKQMLEGILHLPIVKSYKYTQIIFKNGSKIVFRSSAQEDSLRGESVDYMVLDEAAFMKEETFQTILLPMLNVLGKKCLIVTTPKGKNWVHRMFTKGIEGGNPKYKAFRFVSGDNPHSNPEIIQMAKDSMPVALFEQEYLAEFVDSAAIFENINELSVIDMYEGPRAGESYYAGVDIGMKSDYTVIMILNQKGELVYFDRFTHVTAPELKKRLTETITLFKPKKTFIELNNQGGPIYDDLKAAHIKNLHGFNTTGKSKPEIINNLINAFSSKKIKVLKNEILKAELEAFTMSFSSTGHAKFSAPSGFHDDCIMSLAIAYHCLLKSRFNGQYVFM